MTKIPTITCVNCRKTYIPRKPGAPCPKCKGDPFVRGPGRGNYEHKPRSRS